MPKTRTAQDAAALFALFVSGAAALVYEICWIRQAALVFGSTTFAVSTVLAVFFLGLAAGSYVFGRLAQRVVHPLRWFAVLEIGVALYAFASPWVFQGADLLYGILYRAAPEQPVLLGLVRAALVGLSIVPATTLMGGTLPLFCRRYVAAGGQPVSRPVGLLYGLNTLGAATGAALAGFVLLPTLGLGYSLLAGVAMSLLSGLLAAVLPISRAPVEATQTRRSASLPGAHYRAWLGLFFGVGFVALALEVVWFRFLALVIRSTVQTYTLVLTVVLVGIVLGSALAAWRLKRDTRSARLFGALQIASALLVMALMNLPPAVWQSLGGELWVCATLILGPAALSGASFPLAVRVIAPEASAAALGTGLAAASNTLGGIVGALLMGFVVLPLWGLHAALWLTTGLGLLLGAIAWFGFEPMPRPQRRLAALAVATCVAGWGALVWTVKPRLPAAFLAESGTLVAHREGFGANLAVIQQPGFLRLEIDRWWQGESRRNHQALAAHIPATLHPRPESVLLVGVGAGQTAARYLLHDLERLDCVDVEPVIFDFVREHFEADWMADQRVRLITEDGRTYLRHSDARYDVIALEVGQIFRPGVAYFYTRDAYAYARRRLNPGGLLVQCVPLPFFTEAQFRAVIGTFLEVFPQSVLWYNTSELLLIGANAERFPWRPGLLPAPPWPEAVTRDLDYAYWGGPARALNRPEVFLGGFLVGPEGLARLADVRSRLRDDLPLLDYGTRQAHHLQTNELALVELIRAELTPLADALGRPLDPDFARQVAAIQERNLRDIAASAWLRLAVGMQAQGAAAPMLEALEQALASNAENAEVRQRLGEHWLRQGVLGEALGHFSAAVDIRPDDALARQGMAVCLHRQGRIGEALAHYARALALDPANAELRNNLGAALAETGRLLEAAEHFREALRLRPDSVDAQRNVARIEEILRRSQPR